MAQERTRIGITPGGRPYSASIKKSGEKVTKVRAGTGKTYTKTTRDGKSEKVVHGSWLTKAERKGKPEGTGRDRSGRETVSKGPTKPVKPRDANAIWHRSRGYKKGEIVTNGSKRLGAQTHTSGYYDYKKRKQVDPKPSKHITVKRVAPVKK